MYDMWENRDARSSQAMYEYVYDSTAADCQDVCPQSSLTRDEKLHTVVSQRSAMPSVL